MSALRHPIDVSQHSFHTPQIHTVPPLHYKNNRISHDKVGLKILIYLLVREGSFETQGKNTEKRIKIEKKDKEKEKNEEPLNGDTEKSSPKSRYSRRQIRRKKNQVTFHRTRT